MKPSTRLFLLACAAALAATSAAAEPIVYTGSAVMSGQLGNLSFQNALVTIRFHGDTVNAVPFVWTNGSLVKGQACDAPPHATTHPACGYINDVGVATVSIRTGGRAVEATFDTAAGIFVSYDVQNGGIGFGRYYQGSAIPPYPLSFKNGSVKAVADFQYNKTTGYSAAIAQVATDMKNATWLSGDAIACDNPVGINCTLPTSNPGALVLPTDRGSFYLVNPYLDTAGKIVNSGLFSSELRFHHERARDGSHDGLTISFGP